MKTSTTDPGTPSRQAADGYQTRDVGRAAPTPSMSSPATDQPSGSAAPTKGGGLPHSADGAVLD